MSLDPHQYIRDVRYRIDAVRLASSDERVETSDVAPCLVVPGEQEIFSPEGNSPQG